MDGVGEASLEKSIVDNPFFDKPILDSPYEHPKRHWELDDAGQPTGKTIQRRRGAKFITPVPKPKKQKGPEEETQLNPDDPKHLSSAEQKYQSDIINGVRDAVDRWRKLPPEHWRVTPETARLLQHWRAHDFGHIRPFFCQIEAAETVIWLTEVAPGPGREGRKYLEYLDDANQDANPGLMRLALKMATGSGKTTVMAMLIAWQTINAVRHPRSNRFTRTFLVVTPGITIRDRLRVLRPNDPGSYYQSRELVPPDMLADLERARIVITNYHAFKQRERLEISKGTRNLIKGRVPEQSEPIDTLETEGQMLARVMGGLAGMKNVLVINDEAHHCYRGKPEEEDQEGPLKGEDKKEAEKNLEAARLWISGLETVAERIGIHRVVDLSATPFFLRGSGYAEGTLFPWTLSDFSLMDAIECGIVKLPRVPIVDNVPGAETPKFRNLWEHIGKRMPKKGRGKAGALDPLSLPMELQGALEALYRHYAETFTRWEEAHLPVPPCFIIVCNNTTTSKLVHDYISGFRREDNSFENGRLALFRNFDEAGNRLPRPRTLLIDSEQLESGEALDKDFRALAADEIEQFRREIFQRGGKLADDLRMGKGIDDTLLLREVMNTVGKQDRLGGEIRCVVSVSMLTEGWDANTVTHVLGVRAFGTQLLCEQVIGRALRRQSYDLNEEGLFDVEYADVFGIPFDFTAEPVVAPPPQPRPTIRVRAVRPERDALAIHFPRVIGYRVDLPEEHITAPRFTDDSVLVLTPNLVGPTITRNAEIIGEEVDLGLEHLEGTRRATLAFHLTRRLLETTWRDPDQGPKWHLFGNMKGICEAWLTDYLRCEGNTHIGQLLYQELADMACQRITAAVERAKDEKSHHGKVILDPYNPTGSTHHVDFHTTKTSRYRTDPRRCHIDWIITDSDWEAEFCRVAEHHPRVVAYVKNHNLGLEVPYRQGSRHRLYRPDFIVLIDDGHGERDLLHLVVEIKGYRGEDAKDKKAAMENHWVPGVDRLGNYGRWRFAEFTNAYEMQDDFEAMIH
uniref:Type III restriction enzyme n=1 Tax=Candidatus Kentrum sp. LFY TaxID=2126342 RepID=A0A450WH33_9GAMM|nr:MAG: type III restriction enzyme [Candidatus Kentron sp. LFY]